MLGPYELNQIYCGDCVDLMAQLPDNSIDLTVTSPPYDELRTYNGYRFVFEAVALALWRVTKPGGVVVWVVADETKNGSESGTSFRQALGFMEVGFNLHDTMIYEKYGSPFSDVSRYYQIFEYMFVFSKGRPKTVNLLRQKATGHGGGTMSGRDKNGNFTSPEYKRGFDTRVRNNVWKILAHGKNAASDELAKDHPAIFPEALARDHILSWSNPGDIVLDPMTGSGTTPKMAKELGRRFLGFDISQEYVDLARRRVEAAKVPLFVPAENGKVEPVQLGF